jgi:hypothetical protein
MKQEREREKRIRAYDRSHGAKQCNKCGQWFTTRQRTQVLCSKCEAASKEGQVAS